jgi:hypothetical protein
MQACVKVSHASANRLIETTLEYQETGLRWLTQVADNITTNIVQMLYKQKNSVNNRGASFKIVGRQT